jgi:hypothetical protein
MVQDQHAVAIGQHALQIGGIDLGAGEARGCATFIEL